MGQTASLPPSPLDRQSDWLTRYRFAPRIALHGRILSMGDGILWIRGLPGAEIDELVRCEDGSRALVFQVSIGQVGAILLEESKTLSSGQSVDRLRVPLDIGVGDDLLGRVIDPLGRPLDGEPPPACPLRNLLESPSPPIIARDFVARPLLSGIRIVDTLIPVGMGQRELLIGDSGLGKTSVALDTVINQKGRGVKCVYVLVGQKRSTVMNTIQMLRDNGAMGHVVVVVAEATALPGLRYIAPFAGCAIAEYWMRKGEDALVVYDDLTAHANSYRELSLLLRRPPGREAFPADIFSLHARLLERSTCLSPAFGGGSLTALPIIETREGEIASYLPTNLISITDGQIYFDGSLFSSGFLPAIDLRRSVSRVGGRAQPAAIREEAGRMKLDYLQFLELLVFTRFGAKLEPSVQKKIDRGRILREILIQERFSPFSPEDQMAWLVAYNRGFFEGLDLASVRPALSGLVKEAKARGLTLSSSSEEWVRLLGTTP